MASMFEYVAQVRQTSREDFQEKNPAPLLVVTVAGHGEDRERSFKTSTISKSSAALMRAVTSGAVSLSARAAELEVAPIVKGAENPWAGRISVGRARNNDIVIDEGSVSKMHAHLMLEGGTFQVTDVNSHNGVTVNGEKLKAGEPRSLKVGDALVFGSIATTYLDAGALYDFIKREILLEKT